MPSATITPFFVGLLDRLSVRGKLTSFGLFFAAAMFGVITYTLTTLDQVSKKIEGVADGRLDQRPMVVHSSDEIGKLSLLCNGMLANFKDIGAKVHSIAGGEFSVRFDPQSDSDQLAEALNDMIHALESAGTERVERERREAVARAEQQRLIEQERVETKRERLEIEAAQERERMEQELAEAEALRKAVDEILAGVEAAAAGDLTQAIDCQAEGAVGVLACGLGSFLVKLRSDFTAITSTTSQLSLASGSLREVSTDMERAATDSADHASSVSIAAEQVSMNIQTVAAAAEEMSAYIKEISERTVDATRLTGNAVSTAGEAGMIMEALGSNSERIGRMVSVISGITSQTNLLALNAKVQSARAGEAGRGFSVVANQVKELARETEKATTEIAKVVELIQADSQGAIDSISAISQVIGDIDELQSVVAAAVEKQNATTNEIVHNVSKAARGSREIADGNRRLAEISDKAKNIAQNASGSADEVARVGHELSEMVSHYKV